MKNMRIAIDADDAAIGLKNTVFEFLNKEGFDVSDLDYSASHAGAVYPEIGYNLALQVQNGSYDRGILICGTGLGMAMMANKVKGVFAGVCHDVYSAERLIKSNNANVITLGARVVGPELAKIIVTAYLNSDFQGGRSTPKVEKMHELETESFNKTDGV